MLLHHPTPEKIVLSIFGHVGECETPLLQYVPKFANCGGLRAPLGQHASNWKSVSPLSLVQVHEQPKDNNNNDMIRLEIVFED